MWTVTHRNEGNRAEPAVRGEPAGPAQSAHLFQRKREHCPHTAPRPSPHTSTLPVEPLQHDGVFCAQVVCREGAGLPAETLVGVGQVLRPCDICAELRGEADGAASR